MDLDCTPREWDVLVELCRDGVSNERIGRRLFMAEDTVKTHMRNLLRKAQAESRCALAVLVLRGDINLTVKGKPVRRPVPYSGEGVAS